MTGANRRCPAGTRTAELLFRRFHCFEPDRMQVVAWRRRMPRVLVRLGELRGLIYRSDRGCRGHSRTYIHFMERPPVLACDPRGTQLYILGGSYRITRRGIEG